MTTAVGKAPRQHFLHDCDLCTFVDSFLFGPSTLDLWWGHGPAPTVILRFGDEGAAYFSCPSSLLANMGSKDRKWAIAAELTKELKQQSAASS